MLNKCGELVNKNKFTGVRATLTKEGGKNYGFKLTIN